MVFFFAVGRSGGRGADDSCRDFLGIEDICRTSLVLLRDVVW
jgi:hypothetical protein